MAKGKKKADGVRLLVISGNHDDIEETFDLEVRERQFLGGTATPDEQSDHMLGFLPVSTNPNNQKVVRAVYDWAQRATKGSVLMAMGLVFVHNGTDGPSTIHQVHLEEVFTTKAVIEEAQ